MSTNSYEIVFQGLDTLHLVYRGSFDFEWWQSVDLKEKKIIAQKNKNKPFVRFCDDIWEVSERGTREYAYCLIKGSNPLLTVSCLICQKPFHSVVRPVKLKGQVHS